jgi:hypothetical protein
MIGSGYCSVAIEKGENLHWECSYGFYLARPRLRFTWKYGIMVTIKYRPLAGEAAFDVLFTEAPNGSCFNS